MTKVIETTAGLRKEINRLFSQPAKGTQRIVLVAFVGQGARDLLPSPKGLDLICNPAPGSTDPDEVRELMRRGANVQFADQLHMKVYWASGRGALITSANLSHNALGKGGLKELGVVVSDTAVDIERLVRRAVPRNPTPKDFAILDRGKSRRRRGGPHSPSRARTYQDWFALPSPPDWKLGWWTENCGPSKQAKRAARRDFDIGRPADYMNAAKGQFAEGDWVLAFELNKREVNDIGWMWVERIVHVGRNERGIYQRKYPVQALQMHGSRSYEHPPFKLDRRFRAAFQQVLADNWYKRLDKTMSVTPPRRLIAELSDAYAQRKRRSQGTRE